MTLETNPINTVICTLPETILRDSKAVVLKLDNHPYFQLHYHDVHIRKNMKVYTAYERNCSFVLYYHTSA